mgnify:CR=1 FL=1
MKKLGLGKRVLACAASAATLLTGTTALSGLTTLGSMAASAASYDNYAKLLQYSMYFYDGNMCGSDVGSASQFDWRDNCHGSDEVDGGFHDAGDHVKFGLPAGYTASTLGWGYYEFKDSYDALGQTAHLQALTDRFCDFFKASTKLSGDTVTSFCYQVGVGQADHDVWCSPESQNDQSLRTAYWTSDDASDIAAEYAAALAVNYINFGNAEDLKYAKALYNYSIKTNKANCPEAENFYRSYDYYDDQAWAAGWLYLATKDSTYSSFLDKFMNDSNAGKSGQSGCKWGVYSNMCWNNVSLGAAILQSEITGDAMDWAKVTTYLNGKCTSESTYYCESDWGSARYNTALQMAALATTKYSAKSGMDYSSWCKAQMGMILGNNPKNVNFVVGMDSNSAKYPHHRAASGYQSFDEMKGRTDYSSNGHTLVGALVGGPDLKDYHNDVTSDYIYNEVTDDYNAGFCGDLAGLYHFYGTEGKELADKNAVIPDFNMSENAKAGYEVDENTPTGFYVTAGKAQENKAGLQVKIVIHNRTINPPQFCDDLRVRYYFNIDELTAIGEDISMVETRVDYDAESAMTNNKTSATISEPVKYDDNGTYYIEIAWENCNFYGSRVYQFGLLNKMNPDTYDTTWDSSNDYSYSDLISFEDDNDAAAITKKIPAYANGKLVWGEEPDGTKPSETTDVTTTGTTDKGTATTTTTTTTAATVSGSGSGSSILYGDVNLDSRIDITDAVLLNRAVSDTVKLNEQAALNADCDANGELSGNDAVVLLKFLVHIETTLPVSETA